LRNLPRARGAARPCTATRRSFCCMDRPSPRCSP
jgi:hypothetical protein